MKKLIIVLMLLSASISTTYATTIDFYLDSSQSMSGYFARVHNKSENRLPDFLYFLNTYSENLRTLYNFTPRFYTFDTVITNQKYGKDCFLRYENGGKSLLKGSYTDYIVPMTQISNSKSDVSVIISDMILDVGYGTTALDRLRAALNKIQSKGFSAAIIGIKSDFNGSIYSINRDINTGKIRQFSTGSTIKRPIYMIITGKPKEVNRQISIIKDTSSDVARQVKGFTPYVLNIQHQSQKASMPATAIDHNYTNTHITSRDIIYGDIENTDGHAPYVLNINCKDKTQDKGQIKLISSQHNGNTTYVFNYRQKQQDSLNISSNGTITINCLRLPVGQNRTLKTGYTVRSFSNYFKIFKDFNTNNDLDKKSLNKTYNLFTVLKYFASVFSDNKSYIFNINIER